MRRLLDHMPLKLASLALAILVWYVIAGEKTSEMGMSIPVELQNFPKDLELTGDPVDRVEVRLRATPGVIQRLGPGDISAQVDLSAAPEGERIVHLTEAAVRVPFGVEVVKITPGILILNLEKTISKAVPIRPRVIGSPKQGYEVADVVSRPEQATIVGPRSRVREVESAFTEPISVEGRDNTVEEEANVGLEDPLLRLQGLSRVRVTARVRVAYERRTLDGLAVAVRGGAASVAPPRIKVVLEGPSEALKQVQPAHIRPYVDVSRLAQATRMSVAIELVPGQVGVSVHHAEPAEVVVKPAPKGD